MHIETVYVNTTKVICDGNGEITGHPKIYLDINSTGQTVCPYCSRKFVYKKSEVSDQ